jgi:hypothetical protein
MKVVEFDCYGSKHFVMLKCMKKKDKQNESLEQKHFAGQQSRSQ